MTPNASELDSDSEYRVSYALVAALDRDGRRILELLGAQKDVVPIADSIDDMASVLRAHAYELVGNPFAAAQILRELSQSSVLTTLQSRYPSLGLCAQTGARHLAATNLEAAHVAAASAGGIGLLIGSTLMFSGLIAVATGVGVSWMHEGGVVGGDLVGSLVAGSIGGILTLVGFIVVVKAIASGRRAKRLRLHGLSLPARIVGASRTGTEINDVPVMSFALQVVGPSGPYAATVKRLAAPHEVAGLIGRDVRVRADPKRLTDIVFED